MKCINLANSFHFFLNFFPRDFFLFFYIYKSFCSNESNNQIKKTLGLSQEFYQSYFLCMPNFPYPFDVIAELLLSCTDNITLIQISKLLLWFRCTISPQITENILVVLKCWFKDLAQCFVRIHWIHSVKI